MISKPPRPPKKKAESTTTVSGNNRKLLIKRLREIDRLTAKELAILMADAEKIKKAFRFKR